MKNLYSLHFKAENLEISFLIEESSIFEALKRGEMTAANKGWSLTAVHQIFKDLKGSSRQSRKAKGRREKK